MDFGAGTRELPGGGKARQDGFVLRLPVTLLSMVAVGCATQPPPTVAPPAPVAKPAKPPPEIPPPRVALVLGGGGARGFAHVGVLRVLEQEGVPIDLIVGTSVGSLIGAMYAAKPSSFELEWRAFHIEEDDLFDFSLFSAATGPVQGEAVKKVVHTNIEPKRIQDLKIPFVAVATDLGNGKRVEFDSGSIVAAIRASVSIPGVFTPAKQRGRVLVDGGVVANVPVDVARERGADIVIASNITQNVVSEELDNVVDITLQTINVMMGRMAADQLRNADVVISPPIGDVGTMDFSQKKRCMQAGIDATLAEVPAIAAAITRYYTDRGGLPPAHLSAPGM